MFVLHSDEAPGVSHYHCVIKSHTLSRVTCISMLKYKFEGILRTTQPNDYLSMIVNFIEHIVKASINELYKCMYVEKAYLQATGVHICNTSIRWI